jgi:hypothetical protein
MKNNLLMSLFQKPIQNEVDRRVKLFLTGADGFYEHAASPDARDRFPADRNELLGQCLEAWRTNPLARRLVELTSQYVVGGGITVESRQPAVQRFLDGWWNHRLNQMPRSVFEWCDELTRSGELFIALFTDAAGMSYVRAIPAAAITAVETAPEDLEQETVYVEQPRAAVERRWKAYDPVSDLPGDDGSFSVVMLHYAINRPVGAVRGESDLAPLLKWLARYSAWLEDRARLNRFRQTFLYAVKARFSSEAERLARQAALNANPPTPGSILVTDESETWDVISPKLDSVEANTDGLALKKMIASGAGLPLHFLAEPESATRTTAEAAGGPTYRHFEQRQEYFLWLLGDLLRAVLRRRALVNRHIPQDPEFILRGADISARDNTTLASAASTAAEAFTPLRDRGLIDDAELLRLVYRFAGETTSRKE